MVHYEGPSADEVWRAIVTDLLNSPEHVTTSRGGAVVEFLQCALSINAPWKRWITSRQPAYNPAYGLVEFIWILSGADNGNIIRFWNPALSQYVGTAEALHGAYGHRLRHNFEIDQIHRAYLALKSNPESRQVVLQIWDPAKDLPDQDGNPASPDIPCNIVSLLKIRENRLYWTQIMRSNDVIRGLPYNIIQFTLLHELFASWLRCEMGAYVHFSDSMHMYKTDIPKFHIDRQAPTSESQPRQAFDLSYEDTMSHVEDIYRQLVSIAQPNRGARQENSATTLIETFHPSSDANKHRPVLLRDMMCIIGSDTARRLSEDGIARTLAAQCEDHALRVASENWLNRGS